MFIFVRIEIYAIIVGIEEFHKTTIFQIIPPIENHCLDVIGNDSIIVQFGFASWKLNVSFKVTFVHSALFKSHQHF